MPEGIREVFSRAVSEGVEVGLQQEEGESAEDFAKRKETAEEQLRYLNQVWDSLSEFNLTERVDPESKSVCFTMKIGLNPDSLLAEMMKKIENCINCGACKSRCPYGLDTPNLLKRNYEDYKTFLK